MKRIYLSGLIACLSFAGFAQTTFTYTGSVQSYTVPTGITSILVDMSGAAGGDSYQSGGEGPGSNGGRVQCVMSVTGGDVLYVYVGGKGSNWGYSTATVGGYNGGAPGGSYAACGGGASDIRFGGTALSNRLVVAGGGGGGGDFDYAGGAGGGLTGGTGSYGGACGGGQTGPSCSTGYSLGTFGIGGTGASYSTGGGGGGWWGGNAGYYADGGGGGGSSYTDATACSSVIHTQGYSSATGDGIVTITTLSACSGTISGGTAVVSPSVGDAYTSFTLSLSGATVATGLTYDWQSSPDGSTWTDISGATASTYSFTGITANTYYHCIVTCTSTSTSATSEYGLATYAILPTCLPTSSSWAYETSYYINYGASAFNVTGYSSTSLSDASISSSASASTGYLDHTTSTPVQFQQGGTYASSVTWYYAEEHQITQIWIDFNNDGTFQASEEVSPVSGYSSSYYTTNPTTFNISIPYTADTGSHLMRMRAAYTSYYDLGYAPAHMDPCLLEYGSAYPEYYSGDVVDYRITIIALPACSGTPSAGSATTSASSVCPSGYFTLNITGTAAAGETFQWQSSSDSSTWTNISGATIIPYTTSESSTTYYRCVVTCTASGISANSAGVSVIQLPYCYCIPSYYYSSPSAYDALSNFSLTGYSGSTISDAGPSTLPSNGYEDRTSISIDLQQAGVYSGSVSYNSYYEYYEDQVWIDFNDNGTFETSEEVTPNFGSGCSFVSSATYTLTIPLTADTGMHRMRVRQAMTYSCTLETDMDPCNDVSTFSGDYYYYGCTRDYIAHIVALPGCTGTPSAGAATSSATLACPSLTFTLGITGTPATGQTYQWQSSSDSTTWTDISGATSIPYSTTESSATYYRCVVTCTSSGLSATSSFVYVNYISGCYCIPSYQYSPAASFDALSNFTLVGYSSSTINDDGPSVIPSSGYEDRSSITIDLQQSGVYSGSVTYNTYYYEYEDQVWIDFNDNGTFETSEEVTPDFGLPGTGSTGSSATFTLTIPLTATTGMHRMRVRQAETYNSAVEPDMDPCNSYSILSGSYFYYYYGCTRDYTANIIALPACSGTVTGGSAVVTPSVGDGSTSFTLSLSGATTATGLTYDWQSSPDGTTWTDISGGTTASYTFTGISANTYFHCIITCTASSSTATSASVMATYAIIPTCIPTAASWIYESSYYIYYGADAFDVTGYSGSSLSDASITSSASSSTGYLDHTTGTPLQLQQGGVYASSVTWYYTSYGQFTQVWIDFNNDGTFQTSEEVSPVSGYSSSSTTSPTLFNITIPTGADTGSHLMRMRAVWDYYYDIGSAPSDVDPCLVDFGGSYPEYYSGDVVDYRVNIIQLLACSGTPSAGSATTSAASVCPSGSFTLNITGTIASGQTYQWQSSADSSTWTDISGATSVPYTTSESSTTYYRCVVTCTASGMSANSAGVSVIQLPYCYCIPSYYYTDPAATDALSNFSLTGYSGSTISDAGPSTLPSNGYEDRTFITVDLQQSGVYSGSVTYTSSYYYYEGQVWIDFNDNGTFETSEEVTPDFGSGSSYVGSSGYTLTIPLMADTGMHRMRVRQAMTYSSSIEADMDPCNMVSSFSGDYYYYGCTRDYIAHIVPLPACSGTPSAGTATSSVTLACPSLTISLGITGTPATGQTYQWQSSPDSTTWTNISGATSLPYSTTESAATYYRCVVTCTSSGLSSTSAKVYVNYISGCYCTPSYYYTSPATSDAMHNFTLDGYSGSTINDNGPTTAAGYEDRTSISIDLQQTGVYSGTVTYTTYYREYEDQVWIDFNDNGTFEVSEEVTPDFGVLGCSSGYGSSATYSLTIPFTAPVGLHRMRVRQAETFSCTYETDMDPCNYISTTSGSTHYYYRGCTRDYTANIVALPACTGTPSAGVAYASDTTGCSTYTSTLTDTGSSIAGSLAYQWQSSPDGSTWTNVPGATATTYSASVSTTTYYRFVITCTATGLSSATSALTLSVTPAPGPITMSSGGIPGGPFALCYTTTGVTFSGASTGGTWSNSPTTYGTVASSTGLWSPAGSTGTTTLSYTIASCTTTATLIINSAAPSTPTLSSGSNPTCAYTSLLLADATTGGVWSSSSTAVATVNATGNVTAIGSGTTTISYNDGCGVGTYPVTVNGSAITLTPSSGTVCNGSTLNLTATYLTGTGVSYSWSGPGGSSTTTALSITGATISDAGTYTFTTTTSSLSGSCTEVLTLPIIVLPEPSITVTPSSASLCLGTGVGTTASASLTPAGITILAQNFNSGLTGQIGGTWSVVNTDGGLTYDWAITTSGGWSDITYLTGDGSDFIGTNSDLEGSSYTINTYLMSPSFSTVGYTAASLSFNQYFQALSGADYSAEIDYSIDGGTTWTVLHNYLGATDGTTTWTAGVPTHTLSLPSGALGQPNVMLQWHYSSNYGWYWAVDNIEVDGAASPLSYTWSGVSGAAGLSCTACSSPVITPTAAGTNVYNIVATSGSCSSSMYDTVTVTTSGTITGTTSICTGNTSTLTASVTGGTWTSSNATVASVGSSSGIVTGNSAGTAIISYTTGGSCYVTAIVNIGSGVPGPVIGITSICIGGTTTLTDTVSGGAWSSSITSIATAGASSGIVTGVAAGIDTIHYSTGCGSPAEIIITVNAGPASITGATSECTGSSVTLADASPGGTWSSSSTSIAVAASTSGIILGIAAGTVTITYTQGCGHSTRSFVVNGTPASISGSGSVCAFDSTSFSDSTSGGTWSSNSTSIATISSFGMVMGIAAGIDTIMYTTTCGMTMKIITVNGNPASISGASSICAGGTTNLTDSTPGGSWTSGSTSIATVGSSTGVVTGMTPGTTVITYTTACGFATKIVTVNSTLPLSITGTTTICQGGSTTLSDLSGGGTWSSGTVAVATITTAGVVTGVSGGTTTISYSTGCGFPATTTIVVNALPSTISGVTSVCSGGTTTLTDSAIGGSWFTGSPGVATIGGGSGIVSGVSTGVATITYTTSCGSAYTSVTVNTGSPVTITGSGSVCVGSSITLADSVSGGFWSSGLTGVATAGGTTGIISGVSAGTVMITYSTGCGTAATRTITVNSLPSAITGSASVCVGSSTTLFDATAGGTWSSSSSLIANIAISGVMTGMAAGTTDITYTTASCGYATLPVTVTGAPPAISGASTVCMGGVSILSDSITGGAWSSSNTTVATVNPVLGVVTGMLTGTTIISYTTTCGTTTMVVTINGTPGLITGATNLCVGTVSLLTDASGSGTWISGDPGIATIGSSTGSVTGVTGGVAVITFTNGCGLATLPVTVNSSIAISGPSSICVSTIGTLTDVGTGGTWSSSVPTVASINVTTGAVLGVAPGITTITYNSGTICGSASVTLSVNGAPSTITGTQYLCVSGTTTLFDSTTGGSWTSGITSVATVDSLAGIVSGVAPGYVPITYTSACGFTTAIITVNGSPAAITDSTASVCAGNSITLSDASVGGSWSSSAAATASINPAGVVAAIVSGTATISYSIGCGIPATLVVTVNPLPMAISGTTSVCPSTTTTLTDTGTGTWSSSDVARATVTGGIVTGITPGVLTITYTLVTGCYTTESFTVNSIPNGGIINGLDSVCVGATITLSDTAHGGLGTWVSVDAGVATISGGIVTGVSAGIDTIGYAVTYGCGTGTAPHKVIRVIPLPVAGTIFGPSTLCPDSTITLTDSVMGGTWSSSNMFLATTSGSGIVTGLHVGTDSIIYSVTNSCGMVSTGVPVTIVGIPGAISGTTNICVGATTTLSDSTMGVSWSSSDFGTATVNALSGLVTGIASGTVTITAYGCGSSVTTTVTVNPLAAAGTITGLNTVCTGNTITLTATGTGGTWSLSNTTLATVSTGAVTGISSGIDTILYSVTNMCNTSIAIFPVTVNASPVSGVLVGADSICIGSPITLTPTSPGGVWTTSNTNAFADSFGVITGSAAGMDTVIYTVSSLYCGSASVSKGVQITALPTVGVITGSGTLCVGGSLSLADAMTGGIWSSQSTIVATVSGGIVSGVSVGMDSIMYAVTNSCGTATVGTRVTVITLPNPGTISGMDSICKLAHDTLSDTVSGGVWSSSMMSVATISTGGVVTGVSTGVDEIRYAVTNMCGTDTAMLSIYVRPLPDTNMIGSYTLCTGATVTLSDTALGTSGTWSGSSSAVATVSGGVITAVAAGMDTVHYSVAVTCGTALGVAYITVNSYPVLETITGNSFVCMNPGISYHLDTLTSGPSGGTWTSSTTLNPITNLGTRVILTAIVPGLDTIHYKLANGSCITDSFRVIGVYTREHCDSIDQVNTVTKSDGLIKVYPNPNSGSFTVELPAAGVNASIMVMDITGKLLETREITDNVTSHVEFDLNYLARGTYMIKVIQGDNIYRGKVLIVE